MFRLGEKSSAERLLDNKQEDDRYLGSMNMERMVTMYHMYCPGERTEGPMSQKAITGVKQTDKSLNGVAG